MILTEKYFKDFIIPADAEKTMRVHEIERNGETRHYALMTSEAKAFLQGSTKHKYVRVSFREWAEIAFLNYVAQRSVCQKLPFELELTVMCAADPRGNGYVGTGKFALISAKDEEYIMSCIVNGRMVTMEREAVDINEWLKYAVASYSDETPSVEPKYDEGMDITLEEIQEYEETLTEDEKRGNY